MQNVDILISLRVSRELALRIDRFSRAQRCSRSKAIRTMLVAYTNLWLEKQGIDPTQPIETPAQEPQPQSPIS